MSNYPPFTFIPGSTKSISATATTGSIALDTNGKTVLVTNLGTNTVYIEFGGSTVVATTADCPVLASTAQTFTRNVNSDTHVAAICAATETATVKFTTGEGE